LFAAFLDAEQQARTTLARRNSASSGTGQGSAGAFGLDWPVHVPATTASGPGGDGATSKPGSQSSSERGGERDREEASVGSAPSAGNGNGNGNGNVGPGGPGGPGSDWLDFLSGATTNGVPSG